MPVQGTYTAYRQLRPLEGSISDDVQQQEENGFRRRALDQADQRTQNDKADKEAQRKQELWDKHVKPLSNYDTGSKSLNEAQGRLILEAQKQYVPLMSVLNNPKSSDEDKLNATLKLQNLNQLPENLTAMTKTLTERDLAIKKGVKDGTLFNNPDYDKNYQEGYQNKLLALDDNGMPMVAFKDLNGDGKNDLETYDQIQNVVPKYDIQQRFDRDTELLEASKKLQPEINGSDDGVTRTVTTAINPSLLKDYVSNQLYEADGVTPTAKLKSFAREAGVKFDDTKGLKTLSDQFENDIRLRVKGGTVKQRNYNALDTQKEANAERERKQARADKKDKEDPKPVVVNASDTALPEDIAKPTLYRGKNGEKRLSSPGRVSSNDLLEKGYTFPGTGLPLRNIGGTKSELNNLIIKHVFKGKDKAMYFVADVLDEKSSGEKTTGDDGEVTYKYGARYKGVTRKATGGTASLIARKMGYNSSDEALKHFDELNGVDSNKKSNKVTSNSKSTKPKTVTQGGYTYTLNEQGQYE
jgi:hypothetical protein